MTIELQVSRGSVSSNARILEQSGIRKVRDTVSKTAAAMPERGHADVKARLNDFEQFYNTVLEALSHAVDRSSFQLAVIKDPGCAHILHEYTSC